MKVTQEQIDHLAKLLTRKDIFDHPESTFPQIFASVINKEEFRDKFTEAVDTVWNGDSPEDEELKAVYKIQAALMLKALGFEVDIKDDMYDYVLV